MSTDITLRVPQPNTDGCDKENGVNVNKIAFELCHQWGTSKFLRDQCFDELCAYLDGNVKDDVITQKGCFRLKNETSCLIENRHASPITKIGHNTLESRKI